MGKLGGLVWGVHGDGLSMQLFDLILQRQEAGLEIEPDSQFRETLRSDFSS